MKESIARDGVEYASRVLGLEEIEVHFRPRTFFKGLESGAIFIPNGYYIVFCSEWLEKASDTEIILCSFHETRHAYQRACIDYPDLIYHDPKIVKIWKNEFDNYKHPDHKDYWDQEIEKDAIRFSEDLLRGLAE